MKWPWRQPPQPAASQTTASQTTTAQPPPPQEGPLQDAEGLVVRIVNDSGADMVAHKPLSPSSVILPFSALCAFLFAGGALAGVPLGMSYARKQLEGGTDPVRVRSKGRRSRRSVPTIVDGTSKVSPALLADGFWFAGRAFVYGTLLCGVLGVAGVMGIRSAYQVDSIEDFGQKMKIEVPRWRRKVEQAVDPLLGPLRSLAQETLPHICDNTKKRVQESYFGTFIQSRIERSADSRSLRRSRADDDQTEPP